MREADQPIPEMNKKWSGAWKELYCLLAGSLTAADFCVALCLINRWKGL